MHNGQSNRWACRCRCRAASASQSWPDGFTNGQVRPRVGPCIWRQRALSATERTELNSAEAARAAAYIITGAEAGALHRPRLIEQYLQFGESTRSRLVAGSLIPASWVVQAQRVRQHAYREAMDLFQRFDLLIAAAAPVVAPRVGEATLMINDRSIPTKAGLGVLTQPISCIGLPVCTVPVWPGSSESGAEREMPIGVQLIGAPWREDLCLAAAQTLEQAGVAKFRLP